MFNMKVIIKFEDTKIAEIGNFKEYGPSVEIKYVFSDNPSKITWDQFTKLGQVGFFMEGLTADFV